MQTPPDAPSDAAVAALLLGCLRGESGSLDVIGRLPPEIVEEAAARHGLTSLLAAKLARLGESALMRTLGDQQRRNALVDILRTRAAQRLLETFSRNSVPVLVFKGEHLAHLCYDRPDLRPRNDTDVLVKPAYRARASSVLRDAGYEAVPQLEASLISYQQAFVKRVGGDVDHVVDLHWRISNPQPYAHLIDVDEAFAGAQPVPGLGPSAIGLRRSHALLLSLVHPVAHHQGVSRVIWDVDSTRLAAGMAQADWSEFSRLASRKPLARVCLAQLERAITLCGAAVPASVLEGLQQSGGEGSSDIGFARRRIVQLLANVRAHARWADRAKLLRQHLLPSADYMRRVYAPSSRAPLGVLYARRAIVGAWKYTRPG